MLLIILDGFGNSEKTEHNAIRLAKMPNWHEFLKKYPHALLKTSGTAVGLPEGVMGNSEVGHLNLGGGRIIPQEFTRITNFAAQNGFESLPDVERVLKNPVGVLHIMGLLSDGGVHSHQDHLLQLLKAAKKSNPQKKICIHAFMDGRDTPPQSGIEYIKNLEKNLQDYPQAKIATIIGRFYVMDRDKRWERVELAYHALTAPPSAQLFLSASQAVQDAYKNKETDEFIKPRLMQDGSRIQAQDQIIFFNFRADRAREISQALAVPNFKEFNASVKVDAKNYITFTEYQKDFPFPKLFEPKKYTHILGELVSQKNCKQFRIAETEKYAHVTYFFNGGIEEPFAGEDRAMIPSAKEVATYDLKPEMSAYAVTEELCKRIQKYEYQLIVVNYANGDMVGHTGVESAAIRAVEVIDECLAKVVQQAFDKKYEIIITADHGNCEQMVDPLTKQPFTQHTTFDVPIVWLGERAKGKEIANGILADVAPSILHLFNWTQPKEMTGKNLISE